MRLEISRAVLDAIRAAAAAAHPLEACGLLFGDDRMIDGCEATPNVATDPDTGFEIDPSALLRALRDERAGGQRVAGYWHSHPTGNPRPSQRDTESAALDGKVWLIATDRCVSAWRLDAIPGVEMVSDASGMHWRSIADGTTYNAFDRVPIVTGDVRDLVPLSKLDEAQVPLIVEAGYPAIAPILDDLLPWVADPNWPVARPLADYLVTLGPALVEPIRRLLRDPDSDAKDGCLYALVAQLAPEQQMLLIDEIRSLALSPNEKDRQFEADIAAREILEGLGEAGR